MIDIATAIKQQVTCREFAESIGLKINRSGFTVCPFHHDTDASLKVYKGDRGWCCFGCHKGGDVINFASLYYGIPFKEALRRLNDDFQLGLMQTEETRDSRMLAAVAIARLKAQREKEAREKAAAEAAYWVALDKLLDAESRVRKYAPQSMDEEITTAFRDALFDRELYAARLNDAEIGRHGGHD